jgi:hypothetical protein
MTIFGLSMRSGFLASKASVGRPNLPPTKASMGVAGMQPETRPGHLNCSRALTRARSPVELWAWPSLQRHAVASPAFSAPNAGWFHRALRHCPACKREADLLSTRAAVRRLRAKRRPPPPLALQCRQCGAPMMAKRPTKAFCSEKCRVAAHRERIAVAS